MFRYERPQKGRYRQFHQIDAEILGVEDPWADAEILAMLIRYLSGLGLKNINLQINSLGCPECRAPYKTEIQKFLHGRKDTLCEDCQRRLETNPLRIFDCKKEECRRVLEAAPSVLDFLCPDCLAHFARVRSLLEEIALPYAVNPRMVRGLDYYTRTAFEVVAGELGAQNAVCGGGRYDGLAQDIGGPRVPSIGFAIGVERLILLLPETPETSRRQVFLAAIGEEPRKRAFRVAQELRQAGIRVELDYEGKSLKSQMRKADKTQSPYVLILGEEELKGNRAILRDMATKAQEELPLEGVLGRLQSLMGKH
jgi:histidyl-tRNA synthetase